jgi:hypothetical protein
VTEWDGYSPSHMAAEQQIPPERLKELATAAIVKRKEESRAQISIPKTRPLRISERSLLELTKTLSDFYGFKAEPHTMKEHRLMAGLVAETWVPLSEYDRQVRAKEEAQERVAELQREVADLRARIEKRIKDVPRLKATIRTAMARLIVDTREKHVREEWAVVLLNRIQAAREILNAEAGVDAEA